MIGRAASFAQGTDRLVQAYLDSPDFEGDFCMYKGSAPD